MIHALSRKNLWAALPRAGKAVVGRLLGVMPVRVVLGRAFGACFKLVEEAQGWPAERARAYQLGELRRIVRVASKAPYYRRVFASCGFTPDDLREPEDIARLPTIDRRTVKKHLTELCTVSPEGVGVDCVSTGGTGGEPLRFFIGRNRSAVEFAHLVSAWGRVAYKLGMPLAVFRGRRIEPSNGDLLHEYDPLLRHHYYSSFHMTEDDMRRYLEHVATIGPCFVHAYPSSVAALARFIRRERMAPPANVRGIIVESEMVYPDQWDLVEDAFASPMFSCYGQSEKVVFAAQCEGARDYHVSPTYGYFELLDLAGNAVTTPGKRGEIVGTGFINDVVPFLRYRTGDTATYVGDRCPACGRQQMLISDIEGHRTQESLVARDGSRVSIAALNMHDDTFDNVLQYQFFQETPGHATLRVVPAWEFGSADAPRILRSLRRTLLGSIEFQIQAVGKIDLTEMGKATYVDQRIPEGHEPPGSSPA